MNKYTINTKLNSSPQWTSVLPVQAGHHVNVCILLANSLDFVSTPVNSTLSGILTLQRKLMGDTFSADATGDALDVGDVGWRDVSNWSITAADGYGGSSENITASPEPENCFYRLGFKEGDNYGLGVANDSCYVRLGTS